MTTYNGTYISVGGSGGAAIQSNTISIFSPSTVTIPLSITGAGGGGGYYATSTTGSWSYVVNSPDVVNVTVDGKELHFARSEVEKLLTKHVQLQQLIKDQPAVAEAWKKLEAVLKLCHYDENGE